MSNYKSNLQTNNSALSSNNADLQNLIEQIDNLPDAGSENNSFPYDISVTSNEELSYDIFIGSNNNIIINVVTEKVVTNYTINTGTIYADIFSYSGNTGAISGHQFYICNITNDVYFNIELNSSGLDSQ